MPEITLQDLNDLHKAVETLTRVGAYAVYADDEWRPGGRVYIGPETYADVVALLCTKPEIRPHLNGRRYWLASLRVGDLELCSLFRPEELPMIGYPVQELPEAQTA